MSCCCTVEFRSLISLFADGLARDWDRGRMGCAASSQAVQNTGSAPSAVNVRPGIEKLTTFSKVCVLLLP